MTTETSQEPQPEDTARVDQDVWASALAEQAGASQGEPESVRAASDTAAAAVGMADAADRIILKPLTAATEVPGAARTLDGIKDIPVRLSVELGSVRMTIRALLALASGSIVELDGLAGDPMNILVNGHLVAKGEVVVVEDKYGIRITEIVNQAEPIGQID